MKPVYKYIDGARTRVITFTEADVRVALAREFHNWLMVHDRDEHSMSDPCIMIAKDRDGAEVVFDNIEVITKG